MTESAFSSIKISPELQALLSRWLTFHRVLWALTLVLFLVAWNRGLALLYGLFALLAALLLISYLMPKWQLRNIRVAKRSIGDLTAGRPGSITYLLEAPRARYHVELIESLEFAEKKEQRLFISKIAGRMSCKLQFHCLRRGCFRLQDLRLSSAYPFGIVPSSRRIQTEPVDILVFPRVVELSRIPMPLVADASTWAETLVPQRGGRDEFTAVREYSRGDELNRIHWPVSARHQNLVVKMYEKTNRPAMLVVLDCHRKFDVGHGPRSTFEFAVTIAASMIRFASREGIQCFLVAQGDHMQELSIQAHCTDLFPLYEALARLNCDGKHPYRPVVEQAHRRFPQANLITTFRLDSDTTRCLLPPQVTQIDLEMEAESFHAPGRPAPGKGPRKEGNRLIFSVHADQQLEKLFQ
jgi:uncharacterized protein (DUF58 family)